MTKAQVGFLVLLLLAVPKAFADGDTKAERQIAEIATKELINAVRDAGGIEGNPKIEVKAVVEREVRNAAASYCGIAFYVFLDGVGDPRLVYGSVGTGKDIEDARHDAYDEWRGMFVFTLASALGRSKDYLQMEGMQIYCSPLIVRGNVPVGENTADLPVRLVTPYVPIVKKTVLHGARQLKDIQTILLLIKLFYMSSMFECGVWRGPISVRAALRPSKRMRHWVTCEPEGAISMNSSFAFGAQLKRMVEEAVLASQRAAHIE